VKPEADPSSGVRRVYALTFLFLMEVIEKLGTDRALELLLKAAERQAEIIEKELAGRIKTAEPLEKGLEVYSRFMEDLGAELKVPARNMNSVSIRVDQCPIYEAFLSIGLDCGFWMQGLCTNIVLPSISATLNRFDPKLRLTLEKYRGSAEDSCLLRISR
jgi:hypothetical protein